MNTKGNTQQAPTIDEVEEAQTKFMDLLHRWGDTPKNKAKRRREDAAFHKIYTQVKEIEKECMEVGGQLYHQLAKSLNEKQYKLLHTYSFLTAALHIDLFKNAKDRRYFLQGAKQAKKLLEKKPARKAQKAA